MKKSGVRVYTGVERAHIHTYIDGAMQGLQVSERVRPGEERRRERIGMGLALS